MSDREYYFSMSIVAGIGACSPQLSLLTVFVHHYQLLQLLHHVNYHSNSAKSIHSARYWSSLSMVNCSRLAAALVNRSPSDFLSYTSLKDDENVG